MRKFTFLTFIVLSMNFGAYSQEKDPIQTDRPDQTETPFTVPKNYFQSENGFNYEKVDANEEGFLYPSMLFKFGLTETFEFGLISELNTIKTSTTSTTGLTPLTLRFKKLLFEEKGILPTASFIGYLGLPNASSKKFKTTYFAPAFRFTMQHGLSDKFSLSYNLGAEWDGESPEPVFLYTFAPGMSISSKVGCYVELYGYLPQRSRSDHRTDGGFTYLLKPNIQFDISGGIGLSKTSPEYYGSLGFSFRLKN